MTTPTPPPIVLDQHLLRAAFSAFGGALLVSAAAAYPVYAVLLRLKARQTVSQHAPGTHQAKQGTPTMGGLMIVFGIFLALAALGAGVGPLLLLVGFTVVGFLDDFVVPRAMKGKRGLGWKQKLGMQILIAGSAAWLSFPGGDWMPIALASFLVLFFSNAYNFADGLDGLAGSLGLILAFAFAALGIHFLGEAPTVVAAAIGGALIPFLFLNAPPARIFMGDVGSLPIGALFGWLVTKGLLWQETATVALPEGATAGGPYVLRHGLEVLGLPLLILSLIMIIELVPVPLQILSVKIRKKKLFPYTPIHHAFELKGWKETQVVWTFALVQFLFAVAALALAIALGQQHLMRWA